MEEGQPTQPPSGAVEGSRPAVDEFFKVCYQELRREAHRLLAKERRGHTLQTTELVGMAYKRLVHTRRLEPKDRVHFFHIAAGVIRHILVDYAKRRKSAKRGHGIPPVTLDRAALVPAPPGMDLVDILALNKALSRLQKERPEVFDVIEMQFFAGMKNDEIAEVLEVAVKTVVRRAAYGRARLYEFLTEG